MKKVMDEREPFQENDIVCQKKVLASENNGNLGCTCIFVYFLFNYLECISKSSIYKSGYISLDSFPHTNSTHQVYENVHFPTL